jgi:hypothetical protein
LVSFAICVNEVYSGSHFLSHEKTIIKHSFISENILVDIIQAQCVFKQVPEIDIILSSSGTVFEAELTRN